MELDMEHLKNILIMAIYHLKVKFQKEKNMEKENRKDNGQKFVFTL